MKKKISYNIYTLGCKVNQYDSGYLRSLLDDDLIKVRSGADVAVVNTCAVTRKAIAKGRSAVKKARNENPQAKIVVFGCWPKSYPEEAEKIKADLIWPVGNIEDLAKRIGGLFQKEVDIKKSKKIVSTDRSRYFLKIQDGCEQYCTYCIIPYNRGLLKSVKEQDVISEAKAAIKSGYKEIVLCGIHLGQFGRDRKEKNALNKLLNKLIKIDDKARFRLSSIEIGEVDEELIELIKNNRSICPHLHVPLQSGSDKILKLMNRPYNQKEYLDKIARIKKAIPDISLTTDVIVGFPQESRKDFLTTKKIIKQIGFSKLHIFPFSAHEKTKAAGLKGIIDDQTKKDRAQELRELGEKLEKKYRQKFKNRSVHFLVEKRSNRSYEGKNEYYFQTKYTSDKIFKIGEIVKIKI